MQEFLSLFTPFLNDVFGPENRQLPDFGYRSERCLGVHTQISANSTWGNGPFYKKCVFALQKKLAKMAKIASKLTLEGLKYPNPTEVRVEHK